MNEMTRAKGRKQEKAIRQAEYRSLQSAIEIVRDAVADMTAQDEPRIRMNIYRSKTMPAKIATELLRNGTLRAHVLDHIKRFGESKSGEYNVKVSGSGYIIVGAHNE